MTHVQKTRLHSRSLTLSEGWADWALPAIRDEIARLDREILENPKLRGQSLDDARAERAGIVRILTLLSTQAQGAWNTVLPGVVADESATEIMPDLTDRQAILDALSPYPDRALALAVPPTPKAAPNFDAPTFNPFAAKP
mgnify:CR=1 FL=1